ncbi:MAG: hypothetical protein POELPBGB_00764 [Bacteroidia bacterium]|nr:hypothetical protein [Bacteroidia bacterium]
MLFKKTTLLNTDIETAWKHLLKPELLAFIANPLQQFIPVEPDTFPSQWQAGTYKVKLLTLGFIPFGNHSIVIEFPAGNNHETKRLLDNGHGEIIEKWEHLIELKATADNKTLYTDTVKINAGLLTPFIWLYAAIFYSWRQSQWHNLITTGFSIHKLPKKKLLS